MTGSHAPEFHAEPNPHPSPASANTPSPANRYHITSLKSATYEQSGDDSGWAHLGTFGSYLNKLKSDFDSRTYGYKKLSDLVKAMPDIFVTENRCVDGYDHKNLYVQAKR